MNAPAASVGPSSPSVPPERNAIPSQFVFAQGFKRRQNELLIATTSAADGGRGKLHDRFPTGDQAIWARIESAHLLGKLCVMPADLLRETFKHSSGLHRV